MPSTQAKPANEQKPDLVTRLIEYIQNADDIPDEVKQKTAKIEQDLRHHFGGGDFYIRKNRDAKARAQDVLRLFNGRNAAEVARKLQIPKRQVYRDLKQPGAQPRPPLPLPVPQPVPQRIVARPAANDD